LKKVKFTGTKIKIKGEGLYGIRSRFAYFYAPSSVAAPSGLSRYWVEGRNETRHDGGGRDEEDGQ